MNTNSKIQLPILIIELFVVALGCGCQEGSTADGSRVGDGGPADAGIVDCNVLWNQIAEDVYTFAEPFKSCSTDAECFLFQPVTDCLTLCPVAISADPDFINFKATLQAISKKRCTSDVMKNCGMGGACLQVYAVCKNGSCETTPDKPETPDGGGGTDIGL